MGETKRKPLVSVDVRDRDEFDGFALYPWDATDARPWCVVLDEEQAYELARLLGGAEVRRCITRLQDHTRDEMGDVLDMAEDAESEITRLEEALNAEEHTSECALKERNEEREAANRLRRRLEGMRTTLAAMVTELDAEDLTET